MDKPISLKVGQRIRMRREEIGLNTQTLAELIGVSQQQISRYETGINAINIAKLFQVAIQLDTQINWFFIDCYPNLESSYELMKDVDSWFFIEHAAVQAEHRRILGRTNEDYQETKSIGFKPGRKRTVDRKRILSLFRQGKGATEISKEMSIGLSTTYEVIREEKKESFVRVSN
ncbi:helix-turn-helix domain-containing protein [Xenorhabdus bovienii]|uniref:helix-turn-helix domain-containing protein n=1 Tax=Xenorhabdus bovienii TaxID=40576 RepID=UPI00237D02B5|nr:helix-turn-helix transcriptional regulator [Xenorhabdus bovienii]MDE1486945.1 helix-turn-helix domain-containing protein [Xenorhabdus bovienii]MDE1497199.1 helix-turn-helix domain-containing protein [Xenorhabdus bovienii]MDE9477787.1 helix-turn-helix domain-containing protein [Xenorhabdus bovienii]MDE9494610.1 helix-turn-helix domain-containing protein [Xenorhabdus bovienii]MDE9503007.1 helix-turn-helix domain-containing protein [Xenorhabdus bovienii]